MNVPADAAPLFVVIAADDSWLSGLPGLPLIEGYHAAGAPIRLHLLSGGGHASGLGRQGEPSEGWPEMLHRWMRSIGVLEGRPN